MKLKKTILTMGLALCLCAPPLSVSAAGSEPLVAEPIVTAGIGDYIVSPQSDIITWRYKIEKGNVYKRLYNASIGVYLTTWIYVGKYTPNK